MSDDYTRRLIAIIDERIARQTTQSAQVTRQYARSAAQAASTGVGAHPTTDINTAHPGTVGITKGGTGQTVKTEAFDALAPTNAAGDLIVRNASDNVRLGIGTTGQVLTVVAGTAAWAAGSTLINPMTTAGDVIAGGVSGAPQRVPIGTTGQVLTVVAGAPVWSVGGATTLTPIGTTTVGANTEDMVRNRVMLKKITPTRAGIILGVTAMIAGNSNNVYGYMATIYTDNADVPGNVIAYMAFDSSVDSYLTTTLRWLTIPLIATVAANTSYWIGFGRKDGNNAVSAPIAYATSGSDRTITSSGDWITDGALITSVATTRDYSLYISLLG